MKVTKKLGKESTIAAIVFRPQTGII